MLTQFISGSGLSEFVLDGLKDGENEHGVVIDMGAIAHILDETNYLKKLGIKNSQKIDAKSFTALITMTSDIIKSEPPKLEELDFCGIGGSNEQGNRIL